MTAFLQTEPDKPRVFCIEKAFLPNAEGLFSVSVLLLLSEQQLCVYCFSVPSKEALGLMNTAEYTDHFAENHDIVSPNRLHGSIGRL